MNKIFILLLLVFIILLCGLSLKNKNIDIKNIDLKTKMKSDISTPVSIKMYDIIEAKSGEYDIPKYILYNVAWLETRYSGPFHWSYDPHLTSNMGATGPMQIMPKYAGAYTDEEITHERLKMDIELNIDISCKILIDLYDKYKRWDIVLGFYNTGKPIVNDFAVYGTTNRNYKKKWHKP